jgi:hypothetical protein
VTTATEITLEFISTGSEVALGRRNAAQIGRKIDQQN